MAIVNILGVLIVIIGAVSSRQIQKAILYDQYNQAGEYIVLPSGYVADLSTENFDNRVHSVCATGVWLFYEHPNYNPDGTGSVEYTFGRNNYCTNLKVIGGRVSSARYAGHPKNYTIDSLTVYEYTYFQGKEEYAYNEINSFANLQGSHQSIIITGQSSWTVFDKPDFERNTICLKSQSVTGEPTFIDDLQKFLPYGTIRSIRKGCVSS